MGRYGYLFLGFKIKTTKLTPLRVDFAAFLVSVKSGN